MAYNLMLNCHGPEMTSICEHNYIDHAEALLSYVLMLLI